MLVVALVIGCNFEQLLVIHEPGQRIHRSPSTFLEKSGRMVHLGAASSRSVRFGSSRPRQRIVAGSVAMNLGSMVSVGVDPVTRRAGPS